MIRMGRNIKYLRQILIVYIISFHQIFYAQDLKQEYYACAIEYYDCGKYHLAIEYLTRVIQLSPKDSAGYFDRAMAKEMVEDYQGAIEDYTSEISIDSNNVDSYFLRGILNYKLKNYQKSIQDCEKTLSLEPDNSDACYYLSLCEFELGQYQKSLNSCNKAITYNENNSNYFLHRAEVHLKMKHYGDACKDYLFYKKSGGYSAKFEAICH